MAIRRNSRKKNKHPNKKINRWLTLLAIPFAYRETFGVIGQGLKRFIGK